MAGDGSKPKEEGVVAALNSLTGVERRAVLQHKLSWILWEGAFSLNSGCRLARLLALSGGDAAIMTSWLALASSCTQFMGVVVGPIVGSLSDAVCRGAWGAAMHPHPELRSKPTA